MTQPKVIQPHTYNMLAEAMQNKNLRYAFVKVVKKDIYECVTPYVLCRDYLKDFLYCKFVTQEPLGTVYGFNTAAYKHEDVDTEFIRLAVTGSKELIDAIESNWDFMIALEEKHEVMPTECERFQDGDMHGIIVKGDSRWQDSLLGFSYYTFLFRQMTYPNCQAGGADLTLQKAAEKLAAKKIGEINKFGYLESHVKFDPSMLYNLHNCYGLMYVNKDLKVPDMPKNLYAELA